MSEGVGQTEVEDWRRLRACPGCDYSLETLPAEGVCPECGRAYDQRYVVLMGQGRGRWDTGAGGTWRGSAWQVVWVFFMLWFFLGGRRGGGDPQLIGWGVAGTLVLGAQLYARLFSAREPRMQLWMSPSGVAQVASTPEAQQAHWLSVNIAWVFMVVMMVALSFKLALRSGMVWSAVVAIAAIGLATWRWRTRRRRSGAGDDAPSLWPWKAIERIRVEKLSGDRARIRCQAMRKWGPVSVHRDWVTDIEVACTADSAERLGRQMIAWCPKAKAETA